VATRGHVHGRDEVVLDELSKSGDLLVFLLHDLDVLGKLDDSLSVWLEAELRDDAELYLGAEREHELLVADHAVTGLLPRHMQPGLMGRSLEC